MKIDILEAHDRYTYLTKESSSRIDIGECCQDMINRRPFGNHAFYIFAHMRTEDDGVNKRLIWQPRLTKPKAQTNSMLFKGYPGTDLVKIIWMLPDRCMWDQYKKGNVTASEEVMTSIYNFEHAREEMEAPESDDLTDSEAASVYVEISQEANKRKNASTQK